MDSSLSSPAAGFWLLICCTCVRVLLRGCTLHQGRTDLACSLLSPQPQRQGRCSTRVWCSRERRQGHLGVCWPCRREDPKWAVRQRHRQRALTVRRVCPGGVKDSPDLLVANHISSPALCSPSQGHHHFPHGWSPKSPPLAGKSLMEGWRLPLAQGRGNTSLQG